MVIGPCAPIRLLYCLSLPANASRWSPADSCESPCHRRVASRNALHLLALVIESGPAETLLAGCRQLRISQAVRRKLERH